MQAHQFAAALLPSGFGERRSAIREELADRGIATGAYFSPHLFEQPYFQRVCVAGQLPVSDDVSARMISLPLFDAMTLREVDQVADCLHSAMGVTKHARNRHKSRNGHRAQPVISASEESTAA